MKIRLKINDIFKILLGGSILIKHPFEKQVVTVSKGKDTYICK